MPRSISRRRIVLTLADDQLLRLETRAAAEGLSLREYLLAGGEWAVHTAPRGALRRMVDAIARSRA